MQSGIKHFIALCLDTDAAENFYQENEGDPVACITGLRVNTMRVLGEAPNERIRVTRDRTNKATLAVIAIEEIRIPELFPGISLFEANDYASAKLAGEALGMTLPESPELIPSIAGVQLS